MLSFPKQNRLLKRHEFKATLDSKFKVVTPYIVVLAKETDCERMRMGLIVSRKVGIAVVRNKVKRLLRESFRSTSDRSSNMDIVVIARHRAANADLGAIQDSLQFAMEKLAHRIRVRKSSGE